MPIFAEEAAPPMFQSVHTVSTMHTEHMQAVKRVIQTMHTHIDELLTLEDLASMAYLSPSRFHRVFCCLIGIPPGEFLAALRFQTARRLLLTTSLSVTDICFEVGYSSTGTFTTRFTQLVGLSPRLLRQRAHAFEPLSREPKPITGASQSCVGTEECGDVDAGALCLSGRGGGRSIPLSNVLQGRICAPATFRGTIYVGLFTSPIPQGAPVRCTKLSSTLSGTLCGGEVMGSYLLQGIPDGVYHLRAAAFPQASDLHSALLPGEKLLLGNNASPLIIRHGHVFGDPNLVLHPPRLTDPPLVMGLPLL